MIREVRAGGPRRFVYGDAPKWSPASSDEMSGELVASHFEA